MKMWLLWVYADCTIDADNSVSWYSSTRHSQTQGYNCALCITTDSQVTRNQLPATIPQTMASQSLVYVDHCCHRGSAYSRFCHNSWGELSILQGDSDMNSAVFWTTDGYDVPRLSHRTRTNNYSISPGFTHKSRLNHKHREQVLEFQQGIRGQTLLHNYFHSLSDANGIPGLTLFIWVEGMLRRHLPYFL